MASHVAVGKPANDAEIWAFRFLKDNLPENYVLITNVDVYSDNNQPFECDAIVVGDWGVYIVDVKGYQGRLNAGKDIWTHDGRNVENPLPKLNQNARILASRCKRRLKHNQHAPWCQSAAFITGGLGGEIVISTGDYKLPVFCAKNIIKALTSSEFITSQYKHEMVGYQKELALGAICDFKLINEKQKRIAHYKKIEKLSDRDGVELWLVEPDGHTFDFKYWMKYIDITGMSLQLVQQFRSQFKKEYYLLSELSDLPTVPAVLMYHDDGESLALVHQCISGEKLSSCNSYDVLAILKIVLESIIDMQKKGIHHRALSLETIYVGEKDKVQLLDVGYARSRNINTIVTPSLLDNCWSPPEYIESGIYSNKSSSFQFAAIFLPLIAVNIPNSTSTLDFISEDYVLEVKDEFKDILGFENWFDKSLSINEDERPELVELQLCFTQVEEKQSASNDIFELTVDSVISKKYKLIECIGRGGTSSIWRAKHLIGEYECCLKVLDSFDGADEVAKNEFEVLRTLYHPNIVRIFDLDVIPGMDNYFLTCEYLDGVTLDQVDNVSFNEYMNYFKQILSALQYLHRIGRVHKDVKPENIMIVSGRAYLIDFNVSLMESRLIGTTRYKDPLVKKIGWVAFSDIYSLVIAFVEQLVQIHPFEANDEIPSVDLEPFIQGDNKKLPSPLKTKFEQILRHEVNWNIIYDYCSWFGVSEKVDIKIPDALLNRWYINRGYMLKVLSTMLGDMQQRSRQVIVRNTLRNHDIVGNKSNKGSVSAAISALKNSKVVEYHGSKIRFTKQFILDWEETK